MSADTLSGVEQQTELKEETGVVEICKGVV